VVIAALAYTVIFCDENYSLEVALWCQANPAIRRTTSAGTTVLLH